MTEKISWRLQMSELALAVLRRTTKEITPAQCYTKMSSILDSVYEMGQEAKRIELEANSSKKG